MRRRVEQDGKDKSVDAPAVSDLSFRYPYDDAPGYRYPEMSREDSD